MGHKLAIAIETSGRLGSVAIGRGNDCVSEIVFSGHMKHSADLFSTLETVLGHAEATVGDVEQVYITTGPGSFTGLRIAVTAAKMFEFAQNMKIIAADSMDVLAESASRYLADTEKPVDCIATILDAKKGLFYAAVFDLVGGDWQKCLDTQAITAEELLGWLEASGKQRVGLLGEGLVYYAEKFNAPFTYILDEAYWSATAAGLYRVGRRMAEQGLFTEALALTPKYIRGPGAVKKVRKT
jgi:tRNA threonylcarbamoyladenosine biosynthesis protein TsaB